MPRTKVAAVSGLKDWNEVDAALRRLGQIRREVATEEGKLNKRVENLRAEYSEKVKPLGEEAKRLEKDIKMFCESRPEDFQSARSKVLTFGTVGFRLVRKIVVHNTANTIAAIRRLFPSKEEVFLNTKTTLDKEALEDLEDSELATIGCTRKESDSFSYEVKEEKL